jgi:hypothetical protein
LNSRGDDGNYDKANGHNRYENEQPFLHGNLR